MTTLFRQCENLRALLRAQVGRAECLAAICQQTRAYLQIEVASYRLLGFDLPDDLVALLQALDDALAQEQDQPA